jgi:hypothetical protein
MLVNRMDWILRSATGKRTGRARYAVRARGRREEGGGRREEGGGKREEGGSNGGQAGKRDLEICNMPGFFDNCKHE